MPGRRRDRPARPQPALHSHLAPRLNETADDTELYTQTEKIVKDWTVPARPPGPPTGTRTRRPITSTTSSATTTTPPTPTA